MMTLYKTNLSLFAYDPERDKDTNYAAEMQAILDKGEENLTVEDYQNLAQLEQAANDKVNYLNATGTNQWGAQTSSQYSDMYASLVSGGSAGGNTPKGTTGYQPIDSSGIDWDRMHMSNHDYELLQSYGAGYTSAMASGNTELANHYHELAEALRAKYSYSGGSDGSQYIPIEREQEYSFDDILAMLTGAVGPAPTFSSRWDEQKNALAQAYLNMNYEDFLNSDQYKALESRYGLLGKNAMQNVLGQIASRTGGLASSYSQQVASQSYNDYMSQLVGAAYDMYRGETAEAYNKAMAAYGFDDSDYNMFLNDLAQWNREYGYAQDALSQALGQANYNQEWDYNVSQADKKDAMNRIDSFLSMGGSLSDLDPALIAASGYTQAELQQLYNYYQMQLNPYGTGGKGGGGGRGRGGNDEEPTLPTYSAYQNPGQDIMATLDNAWSAGNWKNENVFLNYATRVLGIPLEKVEAWLNRRMVE